MPFSLTLRGIHLACHCQKKTSIVHILTLASQGPSQAALANGEAPALTSQILSRICHG